MSQMIAATGMITSFALIRWFASSAAWDVVPYTIIASCVGAGALLQVQDAWMYKKISASDWSKAVAVVVGGVVVGVVVDLGRLTLASKRS